MCITVMLKSECELFKMFNFIPFKHRLKPKHPTQRRGRDFCEQHKQAARLADEGDVSRLRSRWKMTWDTDRVGFDRVTICITTTFHVTTFWRDIFSYLHVLFNLAANLPLLLMTAALIPSWKRMKSQFLEHLLKSICPKTRVKKLEEEEKKIIYFRHFQKEHFFGNVAGDDWSTWGGSFRMTSSEPGVSSIFASLKKRFWS